ncbi:uncharacterized protein LY89DRAFT_674703 [Mollisia scopiformis]|uniref:Uncharacterized protein n=1 Tax=Mollisia scopiformis TaxID=149040 RepID=A0A194WTU4_MOLSC|nr:uncharacterized protein LY89DRAFT_674703 [Mollisia scopiformis]KUJ11383.1 hypothetical protein LY89DRAFT_674703 [Mollisia scopiformis]
MASVHSQPEDEPSSIGPEIHNKFVTFETTSQLYRLPLSSPLATTFLTLSGPSKIEFLKEHGEVIAKKSIEERGRIMIHHSGSFIFWNEGQIEYLVPREKEGWEDHELSKEFEKLVERGEGRREWILRNAMRIKEWPDHAQRKQSVEFVKRGTGEKENSELHNA